MRKPKHEYLGFAFRAVDPLFDQGIGDVDLDRGILSHKERMQENLVIVESPAKAKTIEKFLGKDYIVKSSFGHILLRFRIPCC